MQNDWKCQKCNKSIPSSEMIRKISRTYPNQFRCPNCNSRVRAVFCKNKFKRHCVPAGFTKCPVSNCGEPLSNEACRLRFLGS